MRVLNASRTRRPMRPRKSCTTPSAVRGRRGHRLDRRGCATAMAEYTQPLGQHAAPLGDQWRSVSSGCSARVADRIVRRSWTWVIPGGKGGGSMRRHRSQQAVQAFRAQHDALWSALSRRQALALPCGISLVVPSIEGADASQWSTPPPTRQSRSPCAYARPGTETDHPIAGADPIVIHAIGASARTGRQLRKGQGWW